MNNQWIINSKGIDRSKKPHQTTCKTENPTLKLLVEKIKWRSSSQDGGVGRNSSLPHTTKRRTTTNQKSIENQKCQKIKLHGTPTTRELKKKSSRTTRHVRHGLHGQTQKKHSNGAALGAGLAVELCKPQPAGLTKGDSEVAVGYGWGSHSGKYSQTHKSALGKYSRNKQHSCIVPSLAPPHRQHSSAAKTVALPSEYLRPCPLTTYQLLQDKEIWPTWKNRV